MQTHLHSAHEPHPQVPHYFECGTAIKIHKWLFGFYPGLPHTYALPGLVFREVHILPAHNH